MPKSRLSAFTRHSVEELLEEGVHMVYNHYLLERNELWGEWDAEHYLISINPTVAEKMGRRFEDEVIVHEWLHPFEDLILNVEKRHQENEVDFWAAYHLERDPTLADYIRSYFIDYGFKLLK